MEYITQNGQKSLKIAVASFEDAANLKKCIMKVLKESGLMNSNIQSFEKIELSSMINLLLEALLEIESSGAFENSVFRCLRNCLYDEKYKITKTLFDDFPDAREDYYEIVSKCCEENLRPFFKSLVSELKTRFETLTKKDPEQ